MDWLEAWRFASVFLAGVGIGALLWCCWAKTAKARTRADRVVVLRMSDGRYTVRAEWGDYRTLGVHGAEAYGDTEREARARLKSIVRSHGVTI